MADDLLSVRRETAVAMQRLADRAGLMDADAEIIRTAARFGALAAQQLEIEQSGLDAEALAEALAPLFAGQREIAAGLGARPVWSLLGLYQLAFAVLVGRPELLDIQPHHTTEHVIVAALLRATVNLRLQATQQPPIYDFFPSLAPRTDA